MDVAPIGTIGLTVGGGFLVGALIGYAIKKVLKLVAIVVGMFFVGLAYLQYQQIVNINWDKLQGLSQKTIEILANATTQIPGSSNGYHTTVLSNLSIPLNCYDCCWIVTRLRRNELL